MKKLSALIDRHTATIVSFILGLAASAALFDLAARHSKPTCAHVMRGECGICPKGPSPLPRAGVFPGVPPTLPR